MGASSSNRRRAAERRAAAGVGPPPPITGAHIQNQQYPQGLPPYGQVSFVPPRHYPQQAPQPRPAQQTEEHVHKTTTVRNLVNLKKASLTITPCPKKPHLLRVSFKFDAVSPCSVTVFPMGTEQNRQGALVSEAELGPRVQYDKGMNLEFPPHDLEHPDLFCVDTTKFPLEQRQSADDSTGRYPLIIRLETLANEGERQTHNLADLPVGCPQTSFLQSQTTFTVLGEENGQQHAKVVKQKIWVNESSYELQEIFGLSDEPSAGDTENDSSTECVVCLVAQKNTTVLPCRHFCMCNDCAKALLKRIRKCPMCRLNITSVLQIQIADRKPPTEALPAPTADGAVAVA